MSQAAPLGDASVRAATGPFIAAIFWQPLSGGVMIGKTAQASSHWRLMKD
ncbi:MAG TPA: hypothetical protein VMR25_11455 [Planctomycetaceae bacterium]|nr:hypothetical protein [Planctomycetaceae bacterium]